MARAMKEAGESTRLSLAMDIRAGDVQAWCQASPRFRSGRQEFYHSPVIVD